MMATQHARPQGTLRWAAFICMLFGNFMAILDVQVVASSLNEIQAGLSATPEETSWLQTSYLIAEVIAIPLSSFMSRLMSTRLYYAISAFGFTLASVFCAMSTSLEEMIVFRSIQGFMGGGMIPTTFAALFILFEPHERMRGTVLLGLVSTLAPSMGPTLGGYLTSVASWHWIFLINIVPGTLVMIGVLRLLHIDEPNWSLARRIDWLGLFALSLLLGGMQYVLEEGPRNDWFDSSAVLVTALLVVIAGGVFFWRSAHHPEPLVSLKPLRDRNFAACVACSFALGVAVYGASYLLPLFLGQVRQYNAAQIGTVMVITGITMFCAAPFAAAVSKVIEHRLQVAIGMLLIATSMYFNGQLTSESDAAQLLLPQVLRGVGILMFMIPLTEMAMATLPRDQVHGASGLFNLARNLGGAFGLAFLNTFLVNHYRMRSAQLRESMDPHGWHMPDLLAAGGVLDNLPAGESSDRVVYSLLARVIDQQAWVLAFNDAMLSCIPLFLLGLPLLLLVRRSRHTASDHPAPAAPMH
jgi:MFS transporter, DHA2 family, multidrug resistance protein